jgi:acetolactate synthase I/II/III large subunit
METISGGHLVVRALKAEGAVAISSIFICLDEGIRVIDVRHEQAAAHAADAWTRVTGKPGVAVVTAGPGTTDCGKRATISLSRRWGVW